mmetsp:Transcript_7738/g.12628  ORF Transcript_7738/g.12628 Transcript_7738/m.12628 type:complete len:298 (-) Transcript_7738:1092-1985(-)
MSTVHPPTTSCGPEDDKTRKERDLWNEASTNFLLTFLGHSAIHIARKAFAAAHGELEENWGFSGGFLGILDTLLMFAYGVGMILNGYVAERFDPVRHLVFAMFGAAFCIMLFALSAAMGISGGAYFWYVLLIILFGLFQSASLPCTVKIVSGWFQPSSHGTVFGIWATNAVVGNLIGLGLASLLAKEEGSRALMPMLLVPALFIILVALCQLLLLQEGPFQLPSSPNGGVPFSQVLALPNVKTYTAAFSMVRTVDVSLFFWIVLYLNKHVGLSQASASLVAMTYDFGLVIGAFTSGK